MSKITLENMEFHAFHGCLEHEKQLGNTFFVTLKLTLDTKKAGLSDKLEDTLNYQEVYDVVKAQMEIPSNLIENVAERIAESVISGFKQIERVKIKLSKMTPPLGGKVEAVSIKLEKKR